MDSNLNFGGELAEQTCAHSIQFFAKLFALRSKIPHIQAILIVVTLWSALTSSLRKAVKNF